MFRVFPAGRTIVDIPVNGTQRFPTCQLFCYGKPTDIARMPDLIAVLEKDFNSRIQPSVGITDQSDPGHAAKKSRNARP